MSKTAALELMIKYSYLIYYYKFYDSGIERLSVARPPPSPPSTTRCLPDLAVERIGPPSPTTPVSDPSRVQGSHSCHRGQGRLWKPPLPPVLRSLPFSPLLTARSARLGLLGGDLLFGEERRLQAPWCRSSHRWYSSCHLTNLFLFLIRYLKG